MGFFEDFAKRVLDSARFGKLGERDASSLKRLLDKTKKRNTILARGLLSALGAGKASESDIKRFSSLLNTANDKISSGREPFSQQEQNELRDLFKRAGVPSKVARWLALQRDEFLNAEVAEIAIGKKEERVLPVPKRLLVR